VHANTSAALSTNKQDAQRQGQGFCAGQDHHAQGKGQSRLVLEKFVVIVLLCEMGGCSAFGGCGCATSELESVCELVSNLMRC
jgi:hypothetical protein